MEKEILYRFFDGKSSTDEETTVREWLEASDDNRKTMLEERRFFDAVMLAAPDTVEGDVKQKVGRSRRIVIETLKAAAVALLVVAGTYAYNSFIAQKESAPMQTVSVPAGQRVSLSLPDGSTVWLNARSKLTYPVTFNSKREMTLEGEAYFEVAANSKKPFVVNTANGQVTALGTKFNVEDYNAGGTFETALISGKVVVRAKGNGGKDVVLSPGAKSVLSEGRLRVEAVNDYARYRWIEGLICFNEESFASIMKEFEKYYGVAIRIRNTSLDGYIFSGKFRHTDGVDYALRVLQRDLSFKYSRDDERQIIYIE